MYMYVCMYVYINYLFIRMCVYNIHDTHKTRVRMLKLFYHLAEYGSTLSLFPSISLSLSLFVFLSQVYIVVVARTFFLDARGPWVR